MAAALSRRAAALELRSHDESDRVPIEWGQRTLKLSDKQREFLSAAAELPVARSPASVFAKEQCEFTSRVFPMAAGIRIGSCADLDEEISPRVSRSPRPATARTRGIGASDFRRWPVRDVPDFGRASTCVAMSRFGALIVCFRQKFDYSGRLLGPARGRPGRALRSSDGALLSRRRSAMSRSRPAISSSSQPRALAMPASNPW